MDFIDRIFFSLAGEKITGVQYAPESLQGMRENLERVLRFMQSRKIRMHPITSREILEGNLKAVMRLILALAAHYKPQSVRHHEGAGSGAQGTKTGQKESKPPALPLRSPAGGGEKSFDKSLDSSRALLTDSMDETQVDQEDSATTASTANSSHNSTVIRRTASVGRGDVANEMSTQTEARSPLQQQQGKATAANAVLEREGSFVRTGSGRKLPKIPTTTKPAVAASRSLVSSPTVEQSAKNAEHEASQEQKAENRKSRPKALDFWESLNSAVANSRVIDDDEIDEDEAQTQDDFRYNTIHRMSMGRRMLPR